MERKIIINADDFGLCAGVNRGIIKAHKEGILTSATIMVNMPFSEEAVELAKLTPTLGVGVHLNLTEGNAVCEESKTAGLCDRGGRFALTAGRVSLLSVFSKKMRDAIKKELSAQIQWLVKRGIKPTHIDSHKHIHCFPVIFSIVAGLSKEFGISAIRRPLERQHFSASNWPAPDKKGLTRSRIIRNLARINYLQNRSFFKTDEFFGIAHTGRINAEFFKAVSIYCSAPVAEIMTHPGFVEGLDAERTRLLAQREAELEALCDRRSREYFEKAGVRLVHYGKF